MSNPVYIYIYIYREREREREMVDFGESDKMIKKLINQTLTTSLVVIFRSLFKEELLRIRIFF